MTANDNYNQAIKGSTMKLRVTRGYNNTQLGGDMPPVIQGADVYSDAPLIQGNAGTSISRLQPAMSYPQGFGRRQEINQLQPANAPMRGTLPQLAPSPGLLPQTGVNPLTQLMQRLPQMNRLPLKRRQPL